MNNSSKSQFGNNSVGFVYFDSSCNSAGLSKSFDYIEFSKSGSSNGSFSSSNCSTSQQFRQRNNYFRGKYNNKKFSRYYNNYKRYSKDNPHNSNNSSFNSNGSRRYDKNLSNNDISQYFHPSMVEDPWAELEKEMDPDNLDSSDNNLNERTSFEVESTSNALGDDTTDSQDESQVSAEESS